MPRYAPRATLKPNPKYAKERATGRTGQGLSGLVLKERRPQRTRPCILGRSLGQRILLRLLTATAMSGVRKPSSGPLRQLRIEDKHELVAP